MDFRTAIRTCLGKYATFSGRARRSELWWFVLFVVLGNFVAGLLDGLVFGSGPDRAAIFAPLFSLAMFLPQLAAGARRLHDTDRSAWWLLIGLVPVIGILILIFFYVQRGSEGPNRFGADPMGASVSS